MISVIIQCRFDKTHAPPDIEGSFSESGKDCRRFCRHDGASPLILISGSGFSVVGSDVVVLVAVVVADLRRRRYKTFSPVTDAAANQLVLETVKFFRASLSGAGTF